MITKNPESPSEILFSIYGRNPPVQCLGRLKTEQALIGRNFLSDALLVSKLRCEARKDGSDVSVISNYGSLLNWLYGSTDINPLPPHYRCRECKTTIFPCTGDGWDMPVMECCGKPMIRDGHSIPIEVMLPRIEHPDWELYFRIAESFAEKAVEIIRKFYRQDYVLVPYVREDFDFTESCFALIPEQKPMPELDENGVWHTDWDELGHLGYRSIKLSSVKIKEQLREYRLKTGLNPSVNDLLAEPVLAATREKLFREILDEDGPLLKPDELCFSSLLQIFGYLHSEQSEVNPVFQDKDARYSDLFVCREDVWNLLVAALDPDYGISTEFAKKVADRVRRGAYTRNRMDQDTEQVLRGIGISDHWITQMKETCYLHGKTDLITQLLEQMELTWFELQESENK